MKKEKTEELFVKWIDGQLTPDEENELNALMEGDSQIEADLREMKQLTQALKGKVPSSVEPPYGDFFNSQLMRKVDLQIESQSPARKAKRRWESLKWAWVPVGAMALVLSFFAGHRIARPAEAPVIVAAVESGASLTTVYFAGDSLDAKVISDSNGDVSAIVVNGISAIRDDIDFVTVNTSASLPASYDSSDARRFH
jgi:anti-sigma factor RsiW